MQLNYITSKFRSKTFPIILVCDNVVRPANVGSLFRLADAFGVQQLVLGGPKIELNRKVWNTSRATEKVVDFKQIENIEPLLLDFKNKGFGIYGLEITQNSKPISKFRFKPSQKMVLLIGSERHGIQSKLLGHCHTIYHVEMYGQNSSMNVAQATSVALYEITNAIQYAE